MKILKTILEWSLFIIFWTGSIILIEYQGDDKLTESFGDLLGGICLIVMGSIYGIRLIHDE